LSGGALALRPGTLGKEARIQDLSEGGARFISEQKIQIQEPIKTRRR